MADKTPCEQLAAAIGAGDSKIIPAIFEVLTDEDEAKLLLTLAPPASVQEASEKTGLSPQAIEAMIDPLFRKGLLFKSRKQEEIRYYRVRNLVQFHDATLVTVDPPQEMLDLWKRFTQEEWGEFERKFEEVLPGAVVRVIPIDEAGIADLPVPVLGVHVQRPDLSLLLGRLRLIDQSGYLVEAYVGDLHRESSSAGLGGGPAAS